MITMYTHKCPDCGNLGYFGKEACSCCQVTVTEVTGTSDVITFRTSDPEPVKPKKGHFREQFGCTNKKHWQR